MVSLPRAPKDFGYDWYSDTLCPQSSHVSNNNPVRAQLEEHMLRLDLQLGH